MSNPILEYWEEIQSGKTVVSQKVYKTYKKIISDLNSKDSEWFYSEKRANHVIDFFEKYLRHSKGKMGGKPVLLELWEKAMLATIFGFVDIEGYRKYQKALLIVGKKNGKSLLSSGIGLYMLVADGEAGPEVYSAATKKDQAKIIWLESKRMVKKSPALSKRVKTLVAELNADFNDGVFKPLASDSDTLDGLNIHCALMDEIHQWKNGKPLYDILADGISAREQPLIMETSTAGVIREDIYDQEYDDATLLIDSYDNPDIKTDERTVCFIYELDSRNEWEDESCWIKANPGLGTIKRYSYLKEKVEKAKANPRLVKNLLCKEFNIRETSGEAWLNFEQINNEETFVLDELKPRYAIGGVDLATTTDLCAAKLIFRFPDSNRIYVAQMYWMPEENLQKRIEEDKIPYDIWVDKGYIRLCRGNKVNYKDVTQWFIEMQEEHDVYLLYCGYDAWSATYWVEDMQNYFGDTVMIPVQQTKKVLSAPMKLLGTELDSKHIIYNNNPVDKWCLCNTAIDEDVNGNIQPHKTSNSRRRIDGTAALLDAYTVLCDKQEEYLSLM